MQHGAATAVVSTLTGQLAARAFFYVVAALNRRASPHSRDFDRRRDAVRRCAVTELAAGVVAPAEHSAIAK